jgi:WD40 repeat protein
MLSYNRLFSEGSRDGTIRVWEVETGRCLKVWNVGGDVRHIAWNPSPDRPILAAIVYAFCCSSILLLSISFMYCCHSFFSFGAVDMICYLLMLRWVVKKCK